MPSPSAIASNVCRTCGAPVLSPEGLGLPERESVVEPIEPAMTTGQRIADAVARVGGSWPFVISFSLFIAAWVTGNAVMASRAVDPFPFILLNLLLSCVAALQAPIIMMSQNRANAHDRFRAEQDYHVNLKAEREVGTLHDKIDHLLEERWQNMLEIQHAQLELLRELIVQKGERTREPPA